MRYIKIDKQMIPYAFDLRLDKRTYTFEIHYNAKFDFFTMAISDSSGDILTAGEKLILNKPLLSSHGYIHFLGITPIDTTGKATKITWDNFNETVFLHTVTEGE